MSAGGAVAPRWFLSTRPAPAAPIRLFCLPPAGGGASVFRHWAGAFGDQVDVRAVALPGREGRIAERPEIDIVAIAHAMRAEVDRAYAIFGHSMGGRIGFEVIRELRRRGGPLPVALVLAASRPPDQVDSHLGGISLRSDRELLDRLTALGGLPAEVLAEPELVELLLPMLRADFGWLDRYRFVAEEPLPVPVIGFAGADDIAVSAAEMAGWTRHTTAEVSVETLAGGHFFPAERLAELASAIKGHLSALLSKHRTDSVHSELTVGSERIVHSELTVASERIVDSEPIMVAGAVRHPRDRGSQVTRPHLISLGSTGWYVWREALLRTTGFPTEGLNRYAAPACAAAAVAHSADFPALFAAAQQDNLVQALAIAADPVFREAVTWQSPSALVGLDGLVRRGPDQPRTVKRRTREEMVARYWQRYCGKNETIGFFGPICWVSLDPDQAAAVSITVGADLLRQRWVHFEDWALRVYGDVVAADPDVREWLAPALLPHLTVDGAEVRRPALPPIPVSPPEAKVLAACDGHRPARELLADLVVDGTLRRAEDGLLMLDRLVERGLLRWGIDVPMSSDAEAELAEQLAMIGEEKARERALDGFRRLRAARDRVAAAVGDPDRLGAALGHLDAEFTEVTGAPSRRRGGQMYAGRGLCYEDTTRNVDVVFGAPVIDAIAEPLAPMLQAARWLTAALAVAYAGGLRELYDELQATGETVWLGDLWYLAQGMLFGTGQRLADAVVEEFIQRWDTLFGLTAAGDVRRLEFDPAALTAAALTAFPADRPGWSLGGLHSPDVQICASSVDAINRGEFTLVLSELHTAWSSFDTGIFAHPHPDPDALREAMSADLGGPRVRPLYPLSWPRLTGRTTHGLDHASDRFLAFTDAPGGRSSQVLTASATVVSEVDGELVATAPDGARWPLLEVFSWPVAVHAVDAFKVTATTAHTPRITIGRMVVVRETWRTTIGETGLSLVVGSEPRYHAVLAWKDRLGLPDQVYVKLDSETKPFFVDLTSPTFATSLCGMLRSAAERTGPAVRVSVSEMLPTPELAWVPDAAGQRYFSELRLQITDPNGSGAR